VIPIFISMAVIVASLCSTLIFYLKRHDKYKEMESQQVKLHEAVILITDRCNTIKEEHVKISEEVKKLKNDMQVLRMKH
jgi:DNA topoisomerase VI subunit B